jgi:6-phosphofructokinase 1
LTALIKRRLGEKLRVRADTFGYLQRSFPSIVSDVDAAEARLVGREAVKAAMAGGRASGSIALRRAPGAAYSCEPFVTELSKVAKNTRSMPAEFLAGTNGISKAFVAYAAPLVGELPVKGFVNPVPVRL